MPEPDLFLLYFQRATVVGSSRLGLPVLESGPMFPVFVLASLADVPLSKTLAYCNSGIRNWFVVYIKERCGII
jgi:hypothetical protein